MSGSNKSVSHPTDWSSKLGKVGKSKGLVGVEEKLFMFGISLYQLLHFWGKLLIVLTLLSSLYHMILIEIHC